MKVLVASSEQFSGCMIDSLLHAGHQVVGVISPMKGIFDRQAMSPRSWMFRMRGWDLLPLCKKRDIPFRVGKDLDDGAMRIFMRESKADLLLVFGWPGLISTQTMDLFTYGAMNVHPSLLPLLRGPDPLFHIVDNQDAGFGLTFHRVVEELDAGPVYLQIPLIYDRLDSYDRLYGKILEGIHRYLGKALENLQATPEGRAQKGVPTYADRFKQRQRVLDPLEEDPDSMFRRTRACYRHHSRITAVGETLIHFNWARSMPLLDISFPEEGAVQRVGAFTLDINLGGRYIRLSRVRLHEKPWWMTPLHLRQKITPGDPLGSYDEVRILAKRLGAL